ncbi:hypothetical protein [Streptomyces rubiginosohelvolus]|uniref:Protein kilB n=1 Tax=Streptomyces rubiginosohelvolus TaxID=67362 RepID=A0ABQ3CBY6_9ACTN|nr:hypothetical protein [Streptomyces pluricolorescens]GGZ82918.1 hypothetical protein GCM10010328_66630 [Streptomyces pluricolorescens]
MELLVAVIAIAGTLLGALVSGKFQERAAGRTENAVRGEQLRRDRLEAVTNLAEAISTHRSLMWRRGDAVLKDAPAERIDDLRSQTQESRSQVTRPLVALRILITDPAVRTAVDRMVTLTYAMRDAYTTTEALTQVREDAKASCDDFVEAAAAYFARTA